MANEVTVTEAEFERIFQDAMIAVREMLDIRFDKKPRLRSNMGEGISEFAKEFKKQFQQKTGRQFHPIRIDTFLRKDFTNA